MNAEARTKALLQNIVFFIFGKLGGVASFIVSVPIILTFLDASTFGIWITCQSLLVWLISIDLGLGLGLQNSISKACSDFKTRCLAVKNYKTFVIFSRTFSVLLLIVVLVIYSLDYDVVFLQWWLNNQNYELQIAKRVLLVTLLAGSLAILIHPHIKVCTGLEKGGAVSMAASMGSLCAVGLFWYLAHLGFLVMGLAAILIVPLLAQYFWCYHQICSQDWLKDFVMQKASFATLLQLLRTGVLFFICQLAALIVFHTDLFVISKFIGLYEAGLYNLSAKVYQYIILGYGIILASVWPAVSKAWFASDFLWVHKTYTRMSILSIIFMLVAIGITPFMPYIIEVWTKKAEFEPTLSLCFIICVHTCLTLWANLHATFLNATNNIKFSTVLALIQAAINFPAVILGANLFGLTGVVIASCICALMTSVPGLWIEYQRKVWKKILETEK